MWGASSVNISTVLPGTIAGVVALENSLESGWPTASVHQEIDRSSGLQLATCGHGAGVVIGWCCGILIGEEAELLRIAVAQVEKRKGVGAALLARFERDCAEQKVTSIFLEVAEANIAARQLYEKFLNSQVGRRKGYYSQPVDDALVMNKVLL